MRSKERQASADDRTRWGERPLPSRRSVDGRVCLLVTIPGVGDLLGLTIAVCVGDSGRFASAKKLVGYSGLTPRIAQSGERSRTGKLSKAEPHPPRDPEPVAFRSSTPRIAAEVPRRSGHPRATADADERAGPRVASEATRR
jgi:hypothetical protein